MHLPSILPLGVAASIALLGATGAVAAGPLHPDVVALRARGPAALEALLAAYDRAEPAEREALAPEIDAVAGQRYATTSRLYWYTDLELAKQAAQRVHRPILALRMLGDLRDDLSCANSRLFRATLYANTALSAFLRSHFVLYWSSERKVPTIAIDFGDGRKIVRTITGNSAHYVLDEQGHVLDVLPGLYAPAVFQRELAGSLALANRVRGASAEQRIRATVAYHAAAFKATDRAWQAARQAQYVHGKQFLLAADEITSSVARAQEATVSKMMVEVPDLRAIGALLPGELADDSEAWSAIGQVAWGILPPVPGAGTRADADADVDAAQAQAWAVERGRRGRRGPRRAERIPPSMVLDAQSRALVAQIHNAGPAEQRATPAELAAVIARLEQHIVADTALDQFTLRQQIHRRIVDRRETEFTVLNAWIYDAVFATPASDPWLGLRARTDFTGLPGDGVVMR